MEIGPIIGIRAMPVMKVPPVDFGLTAVFDIENFARIGGEAFSQGGGESAGGREDEFDEQEDREEALFVEAQFRVIRAIETGVGREISYFA